jgi:hypothetical protein
VVEKCDRSISYTRGDNDGDRHWQKSISPTAIAITESGFNCQAIALTNCVKKCGIAF